METIPQGRRTLERPDRQKAIRQVDTALHWRRFANGLSGASPDVRGFALAGGCSVLLWLGLVAIDKFV